MLCIWSQATKWACFYLSGQTEWEKMLIMFLGTTRKHTMSPSVCDGRTNCFRLTSDHHSRLCDADMILFRPDSFLWLCQWNFAELITVKKSHDLVTDLAMVAKMSWSLYWSHQPFWVSPLIIIFEYVKSEKFTNTPPLSLAGTGELNPPTVPLPRCTQQDVAARTGTERSQPVEGSGKAGNVGIVSRTFAALLWRCTMHHAEY